MNWNLVFAIALGIVLGGAILVFLLIELGLILPSEKFQRFILQAKFAAQLAFYLLLLLGIPALAVILIYFFGQWGSGFVGREDLSHGWLQPFVAGLAGISLLVGFGIMIMGRAYIYTEIKSSLSRLWQRRQEKVFLIRWVLSVTFWGLMAICLLYSFWEGLSFLWAKFVH